MVQKPSNVPAESKIPPLYSQVQCCCSACFSVGRQLGGINPLIPKLGVVLIYKKKR